MQKLSIAGTIFMAIILLHTACDKNEIKYGDFEVVGPDKALLKINFVSSYQSNPSVYFALDGQRLNSPVASRTPYPGGGINTNGLSQADYLSLTPGTKKFSIVIPNKSNIGVDSIKLFETDITLEGGQYQTLHISDTATDTKSLKLMDNNGRPDSGLVRYKFVNLMPKETVLDLYYDSILVATRVEYLKHAEFTMPIPKALSTKGWIVRHSDSALTAAAVAVYSTATSLPNTYSNSRVYTVFALGYRGLTDTRRPYVSFLFNL